MVPVCQGGGGGQLDLLYPGQWLWVAGQGRSESLFAKFHYELNNVRYISRKVSLMLANSS